MRALVTRGKVTAGCCYGHELWPLGRDELHYCADSIPVAFVPHKLQQQPMVLRRRLVVQDVYGPIICCYHSVQAPVIIQIADSHPSRHPCLMENLSRAVGNVDKSLSRISEEQHWFAVSQAWIGQFDGVEIVSLSDQKVFPAVVIVIEEPDSPSGMTECHLADPGSRAGVGEGAVAVVLIESVTLIGKVRH